MDIDFTHDVEISYRDFDDAWTVTGGTVTAASRMNGERDRWRISVSPTGSADVELTLPATTASACSDATTVCAAGDNPLYEDLEATVKREASTGYGMQIGSRFVGTPRAGVRTSEYGRDYRVGYGMQVLEQGKLNLQLGIDAERRESPLFQMQEQGAGSDQRVLGRATVQW